MSNPTDQLAGVDPQEISLLSAGIHAPSAHNAQPWGIQLVDEGVYDLYHQDGDNLPEPRRLISFLNAGCLVENLTLEAPNHGFSATFEESLEEGTENGLRIGRLVLSDPVADEAVDPLSRHITNRVTNRNEYSGEPIDLQLAQRLEGLGNVVLQPADLLETVQEAGMAAWEDPDFIKDLSHWVRNTNSAPDGITPGPFNLPPGIGMVVKLAAKKGGFKSATLRELISDRDAKNFMNAPAAAVLDAGDDTPRSLFSAGRRMLRSWTEITASGFDYHPFSGPVFFDGVRPSVSQITGQSFPVGLYRIGKAIEPQTIPSNRRPLEDFIIVN